MEGCKFLHLICNNCWPHYATTRIKLVLRLDILCSFLWDLSPLHRVLNRQVCLHWWNVSTLVSKPPRDTFSVDYDVRRNSKMVKRLNKRIILSTVHIGSTLQLQRTWLSFPDEIITSAIFHITSFKEGGRHDMPSPLSSPRGRRSALLRRGDDNVAAVYHGQHVPTPIAAGPWHANTGWAKRPGDLDLWPFDIESGVLVKCDVGYLCANFGIPRPLCSRVRPNVRDRPIDVTQTDVRQIERRRTASSLNAPPIKGGA